MGRAAIAVIVALAFGLGGWGATTLGGAAVANAGDGVTVGSERVEPHAIEAEAARLAGDRPRRLAAARRTAASRAIEREWLEREAAGRGLPGTPGGDVELAQLRGAVADALAGAGPQRDAGRFAQAFDGFHERWRSRTRCAGAYHDPYEDRCGNRAGAAAGTCRWMGEATVCALGGDRRARWLVVADVAARVSRRGAGELPRGSAARLRHARTEAGSLVVRLRSRAGAVALALGFYERARAVRGRASRGARAALAAAAAERAAAAAERAAAAGSESRARRRAARQRDPRLSAPALLAARAACARQVQDSEPYMFGFGMQDAVGGAEGLLAARAGLARRLARSAHDALDRRRLRPLARALSDGDRELARLGAAQAAGDHATAAALLARLDARTEPERAAARRLGLR